MQLKYFKQEDAFALRQIVCSEVEEYEWWYYRAEQRAFCPIASKIIHAVIEKDEVDAKDFEGLMHLFSFKARSNNEKGVTHEYAQTWFKQHVPIHANELFQEYRGCAYGGFTALGKTGLTITTTEAREVRDFLRKISECTDKKQCMTQLLLFRDKNISQVKPGIYSPWLHYMKPDILPISNKVVEDFLCLFPYLPIRQIMKDYCKTVNVLTELRNILVVEDFSMLDAFMQFGHLMEQWLDKYRKMC